MVEGPNVKWPDENTAYIVIHGILEHKTFQALGYFLRGFWKVLKNKFDKENIGWSHKYRWSEKHKKLESYISLQKVYKDKEEKEVKNGPCLDFYEYYWDKYMAGQSISISDLENWLKKISRNARQYYLMKKELVRKYEDQGVIFFKAGAFKVNGYLYIIRNLNKILRLFSLLRITGLPRLDGIIKKLINEASRYILNILQDAVIYTESSVRSRFYSIRETILENAIEMIKQLIKDNKYKNIIIVAHSMGTLIAYDALCRINAEANFNEKINEKIEEFNIKVKNKYKNKFNIHRNNPEKIKELNELQKEELKEESKDLVGEADVSKIKLFVTVAPFLDKSALFFQEWPSKKEYVRSQVIKFRHTFKERDKQSNKSNRYPVIKDLYGDDILKGMRWLNFYHNDDTIGGTLDLYSYKIPGSEKIYPESIRCKKKTRNSKDAHIIFWKWDYMFERIINDLLGIKEVKEILNEVNEFYTGKYISEEEGEKIVTDLRAGHIYSKNVTI